MKNMFNVATVFPHNLLQTNPCIRHNFSTQVFRKSAAQLHYLGPELQEVNMHMNTCFSNPTIPINIKHRTLIQELEELSLGYGRSTGKSSFVSNQQYRGSSKTSSRTKPTVQSTTAFFSTTVKRRAYQADH